MDVTLHLPDDLCREAQQRAGIEAKSLAGWFTDLLRKELHKPVPQPLTLVEMLGDSEFLDRDIPLADRGEGGIREAHFE